MDAIEMLKKDHQEVQSLLDELTDTTERAVKTRKKLLKRIEKMLRVHTTLEEEIFYPAFAEAGDKEQEKSVHEAKEEHRAVDELVLPDLLHTDPDGVEFSGRAKVLKELIEHHVEEEQEEMFPEARKRLDDSALQRLAERMKARKDELESKL